MDGIIDMKDLLPDLRKWFSEIELSGMSQFQKNVHLNEITKSKNFRLIKEIYIYKSY